MSEAATEGAAPAAENADIGMQVDYGSVGDIQDALGFENIEDLAPDERPAGGKTPPADELAARRDDKGRFAEDGKPKPDAKTKADDDIANVRDIEARGKAKRRAREAARAAAAPKPMGAPAPAAAPAAKPETPRAASAEAAPPARALGPVETAVKDVLLRIDEMARTDAEAAAAAAGAPAPDTAERKKALDAITAKLDEIKQGLTVSEEGKKQLETMQIQIKALESDRIIRAHVTHALAEVGDEVPVLMKLAEPAALRAFNKENGTSYVDVQAMIGDAAGRYFEKTKLRPNFADIARRIEKKLVGASPEQTETTETEEKPRTKSKSVSRNDGSPPAARSGPDDRTYEQAIADFNSRFGIE